MQVWEPETFWKLFNNTYFGEHLRTSASPFSSIQENSINLLQFINCRSSSPPEVFLGKGFYRRTQKNMQIYRRTPTPKYDFTKVALQLYWNPTLAYVFSCTIAAYFQNTLSQKHIWRAASAVSHWWAPKKLT